MKYKVLNIFEAEYGCEEMPEGAEPMVDVKLEAEDGTVIFSKQRDSYLYAENINEGDMVRFSGKLLIHI